MYKNYKVSLCLPCRNEATGMAEVLAAVPDCVDEIIVVSNRSTDETLAVARGLGARVFEDNRTDAGIGYGYAHMTAIEQATGDIIIGADCDGTYPLADIPRAIDHLLKNNLDFVSCNRYPVQKGTTIPATLRFGVGVLNKEVQLLFRHQIQDILSGMWVFRGDITDKLTLTQGGWNLSPEIKINAMIHPDIAFGELPISQHRRLGKTHQNYLKTGLQHLGWIAEYRILTFLGLKDRVNLLQQFVRYTLVAGAMLAFELVLLYSLVTWVHQGYILAATIAFIISLACNYAISKRWVFHSSGNRNTKFDFTIFCLIGVVSLILNDGFIWILTEEFNVYFMTSKLIAAVIIFLWSFTARYYLFNSDRIQLRFADRLEMQRDETVVD